MAFDEVGTAVGERGERKREELLVGNDDDALLEMRGDGRDEQRVALAQQFLEGRFDALLPHPRLHAAAGVVVL